MLLNPGSSEDHEASEHCRGLFEGRIALVSPIFVVDWSVLMSCKRHQESVEWGVRIREQPELGRSSVAVVAARRSLEITQLDLTVRVPSQRTPPAPKSVS